MTITTVNNIVSSGLAAARPATPALATPAAGSNPSVIYIATDTGTASMWDFAGAAWVTIGGGGGGGGALTQVSKVTTAASAASITFSSIPAGGTDLILSISGQVTYVSSGDVLIQAQFNGDTGANYDFVNSYQSATGGSAADGYGVTSTVVGDITTNFLSATESTGLECVIFGYAGTTFFKNTVWNSSYRFGTSAGNFRVNTGAGIWQSTAAINSIVLTPSSGTFTNGTVATLWKRT